jgi:vitamin B12 transporter
VVRIPFRSVRDARIAFAVPCLAFSIPALAADVIVTATRAPAESSSIGESLTVLSADEIRATQKTAVSDLLATLPGVVVTRNGGPGAATSVRIRGAETDQTVVLIDGVKLNDPSAVGGGFNFGNLLVSGIERMEVLRGAQSTLWGSQAIGGVVNIVTPRPQGPLASTVDVQAGAFDTFHAIARTEAGNETFGWRIGASYLTTDGVSAFDERLGGREDDGYRNVGFNARGVWQPIAGIEIEARTNFSRGRSEFDGFPPPYYEFADTPEYGTTAEWVSYAGVKIDSFAGRLQHRIGIAHTDTDRGNYDPASSVRKTFDSAGTNLRYEYQGTFSLNERVRGVFGLERERSELRTASPSEFDPNPMPLARDVSLDSLYAQLQISPLDALTLSAGMRYDDHETFGDDTSAQFAVAWSVTDTTTLRASYGEGFKAPTLFQLFSEYGTATLQPEESEDWDIGVEQHWLDDKIVLAVTYFERTTDHMIDFVSCWGVVSAQCALQPNGYYENIAQTRADGYEVTLAAAFTSRLRLNASYTALDAREDTRSKSTFNNRLARRPRDTAAASLSYDWPFALTTTLAAQYVGRSFDDAANTFVLDDYTLVDVRASYRLSDKIELYGRIENAFDEAYATSRSYGAPGRGAYLGVRVSL